MNESVSITSPSIEAFEPDECDWHRVYRLLERLQDRYLPPLGDVVELESYSCKLAERADLGIAVFDKRDVGIIAIYTNAVAGDFSFISTIAVDAAFEGTGLAARLLRYAKSVAQSKDILAIQLEVTARHRRAIRFYQRHGFEFLPERSTDTDPERRTMECQLNRAVDGGKARGEDGTMAH